MAEQEVPTLSYTRRCFPIIRRVFFFFPFFSEKKVAATAFSVIKQNDIGEGPIIPLFGNKGISDTFYFNDNYYFHAAFPIKSRAV